MPATKTMYPCQPATAQELAEKLRKSISTLKEFLHPVTVRELNWGNVHHLQIYDNHSHQAKLLMTAGVHQGAYVNHNGSWLLVILPEGATPEEYLKHCEPCLQALSIEGCNTLTTLPNLGTLTQLTQLNLWGCSSLNALPGLENLTQLTQLNLSFCSSLTTLPGLENLTQLTHLALTDCRSLTTLPGLEKLTQLTQLNLSFCSSLTTLPGLEKLTQLTRLNLLCCTGLNTLSGLENLTQLTELNLSNCIGLNTLPGLEKLTQLTKLDLSICISLTTLPGLEKLTQLTKLDLSHCTSLKELPPSIQNLASIRSLALNAMKLRTLPDWLPEIAEKFARDWGTNFGKNKAIIYLDETTVEDILDMSIFDQPFEVIEEFFRKRRQGQTQMLNEIKVVFLGDGEAGKSHTIARLMNDGGKPVDYTDQATPGIVIKHKDYTVDGRTFRVNYWDFGGQEIMHSMHRIFLTGRTMYVVLLNARDDTQGDRARYWLHNIQSFAPDAPVLLVLNKIDQNPKASVDERTLRSRYPGLTKIVPLSALEFDRENFNSVFTNVLLKEIKDTGFLDAQWPNTWIAVKRRLENMKTHYILGHEYRSICQECQVGDVQTDLLHWFNDLGVSFCFCDKDDYALKKHVILRPDWITNGLYIILFNECAGAANGLIPHKSIYDLLERSATDSSIRRTLPDATYDKPGDVEYVLGVMRKFQISLTTGDGKEFIPMLCQQDSKVDLHYYERDEKILEFCMNFEYLPDNLLHRLMVERHSELDMDNVWRTGAKFQLPDLGLSAVVVIDGNTLRFFIRHTDSMHRPNTYLAILKENVDQIVSKMGLKPPTCKLIYKVDGKRAVFSYKRLLQMRNRGHKDEYCEDLDREFKIEDILNQSAPDDPQKLATQDTRFLRPTTIYNGPVTIVHGDHVEGDKIQGDQHNNGGAENLIPILDKLIEENIQTNQDFVNHLLEQLDASEDNGVRKLSEEIQADPEKKRNIFGFLRKTASGVGSATSILADAPDAIQTLSTIKTLITAAAISYGPQIADLISQALNSVS